MSHTLKDVAAALEVIAPLDAAEPWDNVGLIAGDPSRPVRRVLLCIDYTAAVARGAEPGDLVVAYHPPLFDAVKRLTAAGPTKLLFDALSRGISIYSPHTALDVAPGGTNDVLADILGLTARRPLKESSGAGKQYKLAVTVPPEDREKVAAAIFQAGGGGIGAYSHCSFRHDGVGSFQGDATTNPAIGQAGRYTETPETKLEVLVDAPRVAGVVAALKAAHPYEEPAIDLIPLAALPSARGIGRIGALPPTPRRALFDAIKSATAQDRLLVAGPTDGDVTVAACCAGAGGSLVDAAIAAGAQLYLTGELRHHDALKAAEAGMTVVATLHSNSERLTLGYLESRLASLCPGLPVIRSAADRDPFGIA
jgi:dinuclear metal center YbgI/SA1388 family protein